MNDNSLYFELFSIALLLCLGSLLLSVGLPGWGLIAIAALLTVLSFSLRTLASVKVKNSSGV